MKQTLEEAAYDYTAQKNGLKKKEIDYVRYNNVPMCLHPVKDLPPMVTIP